MRRELARAVTKAFSAELKRRFPDLREFRDPDFAGVPLFAWEPQAGLSFYIALVTWGRGDRFTVEGAWSKNGRFPAYAAMSYPRDYPEAGIVKDEPKGGEFRFRLAKLWMPRGEFWWDLPPRSQQEPGIMEDEAGGDPTLTVGEMSSLIQSATKDAVDRIEKYWTPYCRSIIVQETAG